MSLESLMWGSPAAVLGWNPWDSAKGGTSLPSKTLTSGFPSSFTTAIEKNE
jgi:hypothetical protein